MRSQSRRSSRVGQAATMGAALFVVFWYLMIRSVSEVKEEPVGGYVIGREEVLTEVKEKGKCWYEVEGGVCVEGGKVVVYRSKSEGSDVLGLCTGFPQKKPEGSEMKLYRKRGEVPLEPNSITTPTVGYFVMLTLETNLFHVIRDTIANVADMMAASSVGYPAVSRVFLLPKNPAFQNIDHRAYHPLLAGITGGGPHEWSQSNLIIRTADVKPNQRICVQHAFIGQPFKGYSNGDSGRLRIYKERVYKAFGLEEEKVGKRVTIIDRSDDDDDVNRKVGNIKEIISALEERGFQAESVRFHKLTLLEQLATTRRSSILLGPHGQALSWCTFLPHSGICFELSLWRDTRPDYKLLSKWSDVTSIFIPLPNPSQVHFPLLPDLSDSDKNVLNYYKPFSNYIHRQKQIIYPDITLVKSELDRAKDLLLAAGLTI